MKKYYRNANDKVISGVCSGFGDFFDIDPTIIRILFASILLLSGGFIFWLYIIICLITEEK